MDLVIVKSFVEYGLFTGLFIALFIYTQKQSEELRCSQQKQIEERDEIYRAENKEREKSYQEVIRKNQDIIESLGKALGDMEDVKKDLTEIKKFFIQGDD